MLMTLPEYFNLIPYHINKLFELGQSFNRFVVSLMSENGNNVRMMSSNVSFCPQPEDIQFSVTEKERNQKILTSKKLEAENLF